MSLLGVLVATTTVLGALPAQAAYSYSKSQSFNTRTTFLYSDGRIIGSVSLRTGPPNYRYELTVCDKNTTDGRSIYGVIDPGDTWVKGTSSCYNYYTNVAIRKFTAVINRPASYIAPWTLPYPK